MGIFMHSKEDMAEENGYRRGFDQGMYIAIKIFKDGKTLSQLEKIKEKVHRWRYNGKYGKKNDIRIAPPINL